MHKIIEAHPLGGTLRVPSSKSHTIRILMLAALARGETRIYNPLVSADTLAARDAIEQMGASVAEISANIWIVRGTNHKISAKGPINVGNSGTTLFFATALAALASEEFSFDGDASIRTRTAKNLLAALRELGATVEDNNNGCVPYKLRGPLLAGRSCSLAAPTSQYLSALLFACAAIPTAGTELPTPRTEIKVLQLNEKPYVDMTLDYLRKNGISAPHDPEYKNFSIPANQFFTPMVNYVPADYSSATFFLCAGALSPKKISLVGLDPNDTQGDKRVISILESMGCELAYEAGTVELLGQATKAVDLDLSDIPDALPALSVLACNCPGQTKIFNVAHARQKETDRIAIMALELKKMGADIEELADGLLIKGAQKLHGAKLSGHGDHRIVMALAIAASFAEGPSSIDDISPVAVTYPNFFADLEALQS